MMGEIPADVLSGARHAPLVPNKRILSSGFVGQAKLHSEASPDEGSLPENNNDTDDVSAFHWHESDCAP